jgi:hypothetical protein
LSLDAPGNVKPRLRLLKNSLRSPCGSALKNQVFLVDEKRTRFLKYFVEFFGGHFSN